ncbi:MAG: glycoside hydrolase family 5 protein [Bacilli bacterium]|nr:glycoside hydrolase family 5 protein [Bacilli bacterium]
MKKTYKYLLFLLVALVSFKLNVIAATPIQEHGKLRVSGTHIVDKNNNIFQIRGVSTHGIYWYPKYVNKEAFIYMRDNWGINTIRLAMYSDPSCGRSYSTYELVKQGVEAAKSAGLYVIIDWHILSDGDPNIYKNDAIEFFRIMANLYKDYDNIIYEICNEPNGYATWDNHVFPYANNVINEIRKIDDDAIIAVGSSTWSQDLDLVAKNPITGYSNIVYTMHFYAGTHKDNLRNKLVTAINNGLPVLISEFGMVNADGNGGVDYESAAAWMNILNNNNIGFVIWQLSNKNEGSSLIRSDVTKLSNWTYDELSAHGKWFYDTLKQYKTNNQTVIENTTITENNNNIKTETKEQDTNEINIQDNSSTIDSNDNSTNNTSTYSNNNSTYNNDTIIDNKGSNIPPDVHNNVTIFDKLIKPKEDYNYFSNENILYISIICISIIAIIIVAIAKKRGR